MQLGPNFKLGTLLLIVAFVISAAALFGGAQLVKDNSQASASGGEGPDGGGGGGGPVAVRIVAKDLKFDKRSFVAGPGAPVSVTLDNQDAGVLHNIAFYTNSRATTKIAGSDPAGGPILQEVKFTAPSAPGNYFYRCDVHPDTMSGTFTVR
jgi:plastocyanin